MKKTHLLALLASANAVALWLLLSVEPVPTLKLDRLADADPLIRAELAAFQIPADQIREREITPGDTARRILYLVSVPPAWPKTRFHLHLVERLREVGLDTWGVVEFPDRTLRIHVLWQGNVTRTIELRTDPDAI